MNDMSKHGDPDIDLYADDSEFNTDADFNHDGNVDLYDDVISAPSEDPNGDGRPSSRGGSASPHRHSGRKRAAVYVGNLTWWTTDKDMIDALQNLGVTDVLDVKFFENRANGQSKGFCVITLASEASLRIVMEKFAKKEIHGQTPVVTSYTRQNLNYFENQSRKGGRHERDNMSERRSRDRDREHEREGPGPGPGPRGMPSERSRSRGNHPQQYPQQQRAPPHPHMQHPPPQGPPPPQYQPGRAPWMSAPPPQIHQMPPPPSGRPGMPPGGVPPLPPGLQSVPPPRPGPPPPGNMRVPPPNNMRGPLPPMGPRQLGPPDVRGHPPGHEWERPNISQPPPQQVGMPPQIGPPNRPPPPVPNPGQGLPPSIPPPAPHAPSPHINPAFFHQQGVPPGLVATSQPADMYNRPPPVQFTDYRPSNDRQESSSSVSESEFEEIMGRNRTVSSSAIARAVADASAGDYASAIETLVTAISLIKQSKVANDERCKILISSLQDTLHGIESKSYGSRSKERARSRERERSRERSSRREKSSRRDRSRSRDREYRDRSRERDRYHEDRYRDKDRDHDRDRRSSRH